MSLTPLPFLRIGFAILGLALALALALDDAGGLAGSTGVLVGAAAFALTTAIGEWVVRRVQRKAAVAASATRKGGQIR